jgi:hypothetical protein
LILQPEGPRRLHECEPGRPRPGRAHPVPAPRSTHPLSPDPASPLAPNGAKEYSHECNERVFEQVELVEPSPASILPRRGQRRLTDN